MQNQSEDSTILSSRDKFTVAIEGGLMLLMNFIALTGNFFLCLVIVKKQRFHTTNNIFIMSLAICYLFSACLVMPFTSGALIKGRWPFGRVSCDIQGFVSH